MMTYRTRTPRVRPLTLGILGVLAGLSLVAAGCERPLIVAPSNTQLTLLVPQREVPLNGSVDITAILTTPDGVGLDDGSTVFFSSTLGSMEPVEVRVSNGRAAARLLAGTIAGVARIQATSGGLRSDEITIQVGPPPVQLQVGQITLTSLQPSATTLSLVATVYDRSGFPVVGAVVTFKTTAGTLSYPTVITDGAGRASTTLYGGDPAIVSAEANGVVTNLPVSFDRSGTLAVNVSLTPTTPRRGDAIVFTARTTTVSGAPVLVDHYEWIFSDGRVTTTGNTVTRAFIIEGNQTLLVRAFGVNGGTGVTQVTFHVD